MKKILIAYFSHSGKTRAVAEKIRETVEGDLFEIQSAKAYPENYNVCVEQAKKEIAAKYQPALKNRLEGIEQYDTIFLGSPVWWYTVAPPVATFLSEYDMSGKKIAVFCTHGGGGISRCVTDVDELSPNAELLEGIAFRDSKIESCQKELSDWICRMGLPERAAK